MCQAYQAVSNQDEFASVPSGHAISHLLYLRTRDQPDVTARALAQIQASGGLVIDRQSRRTLGYAPVHSLSVTKLSAREARSVADRLAALDGVEDVWVEHRLVRLKA